MEQIGYSLIDKNNKEIRNWGEYGLVANKPEVIKLPNGKIVNAPELYGNFGGYKLVKRFVENNPPSEFFSPIEIVKSFNNSDILITYYYGNKPNIAPYTVSPIQFRKALNQLKKRKLFDDYINSLDQDFKDFWEYALIIKKDEIIFSKMVNDEKITSEEIDDIFRLASTL